MSQVLPLAMERGASLPRDVAVGDVILGLARWGAFQWLFAFAQLAEMSF